MKIILTTGGTGGHIFPALAVAEQLQLRGVELLFVGSQYGTEAKLAAQAGIPFRGLPVRGVLGRGLRSIGAAFGLLKAIFQARGIVREFGPDAVIGFGAYASFAPLVAAWLAGVPLAIHEQNAMPGMTNRLLARIAHKVFLSLPDSTGAFPAAKCEETGNPVRTNIAALGEKGKDRDFSGRHLLVMGGSLGARAINRALIENAARLLEAGVSIRHQTGPANLEQVRRDYAEKGLHADGTGALSVTAFIDDMAETYTWADLVLCRAGATSVFELAAAGKPAVLIPFPYATHDHQTWNAKVMAERNAALLVPENTLPQVDLGKMVLDLLENPARLQEMSAQALACAKPDAANAVANGLLALCAKKS